jgi:RHS repeat-associated protein
MDSNGNVISRSDGAGYTFGYDSENRMTRVSGAASATYTYDYQGRRTSKTVGGATTTYLYDGSNLVAEMTAGTTSYYLFGSGIDEPLAMSRTGQVSYFDVDGLGSVVATNDPAGNVTLSTIFDAWGNTKSELGARLHPFTYTGREVGEAGTLFYRARYYQPGLGRFTQEDPVGRPKMRYAYANSQPITLIDPEGLDAVTGDMCARVCFYSLWKDAGFGRVEQERAAWLSPAATGGGYECTRWPWSAAQRRETWKGPIPTQAIGIAHTHPDSASSRPSLGGKPSDEATARNLQMPIYVVTRGGIWKFDPATGLTTQEEDQHWHDGIEKKEACCEKGR